MEHNFECRLPDRFLKGCNILLVDPMLATGDSYTQYYYYFCVSPIDFTPIPMLCLNGRPFTL
jgi:uracil phosphoribosyltransferase